MREKPGIRNDGEKNHRQHPRAIKRVAQDEEPTRSEGGRRDKGGLHRRHGTRKEASERKEGGR